MVHGLGIPLVKSDFYEIFGAGFDSGCIGSERDPARHAGMKRFLVPAFSTKALSDQEDIVQGCVDDFITKLKTAGGTGKDGLDMTVFHSQLIRHSSTSTGAILDHQGLSLLAKQFNCVSISQPSGRCMIIS